MALVQLGRNSWGCTPGAAKGAAFSTATSTGLERSWDPALEVNPGESLGGSFPTLQQLQLGGKVPLGDPGRASSAGTREQQGSWEWNRKVQVTQIFLAQRHSWWQLSTVGERRMNRQEWSLGRELWSSEGGDEGPGDTIRGHWRKEGQEGARPPGVVGSGTVTRGATWTPVS